MSTWYRDGEPVETVSIDDRAFQYGDGLFETLAVRAGRARLWDFHMQRLARGCSALGIAMPDIEELQAGLATALDRSNENPAYCVAKLIISSGTGRRGYGRSTGRPGEVYIGVFPARPVERRAYRRGVDVLICKTRLAVASPVAGLKTLNRLEQVMGRSEVLEAGAFEGLMCDADGRVICGTMSNVFIAAKKSIKTPSLDRSGVEGVMRRLAIEALGDSGLEVEVCDIDIDELHRCEEVFLTNSQFGVLPVASCGESRWPVGHVTRSCLGVLADRGIAECRA